jgi:hypothetical protein
VHGLPKNRGIAAVGQLTSFRTVIAGANGITFAYQPSKGYVGPDEFAVEVAYRQGREPGKFVVHFSVVVQ